VRTIALLYHDIVPAGEYSLSGFQSADANIYKLDCDEFKSHLREIARAATQPPRDASDAIELAWTRLLLTFDDGGVSAILYVAELLEGFGWRGHFFITTGRIGTSGFLDESQIRRLHDNGHVIGSHSCSHPARMSYCSPEQLDLEWGESTRVLTRILGAPVTTASVPGGYYSRRVATAAARFGIRVLFTSEPVASSHIVDGCVVLGRFSVQQGVPREWVASLVSGHVIPRFRQYLFWNCKKILKAVGGEAWLSVRRKILAHRLKLNG
jgi:peptidoglycan/xylan/chitin deacetylase (PgdA/CDA1 family)